MPLELRIVILAMLPILEQKAAIPIGVLAGMGPLKVYILTWIGAVLPSPFIIVFITSIFDKLKQFGKIGGVIEGIERKAMGKSEQIKTYQMLGLLMFVAIPLPGTGVWTGSLIAALLGLKKKQAIGTVFLGAAVCGLLILLFTQGIAAIF